MFTRTRTTRDSALPALRRSILRRAAHKPYLYIRPEEIYNLGAQSHVKVSFDIPEYTGDTTGLGTTRILEAVRRSGIRTRFYQQAPLRCSAVPLPPQRKDAVSAEKPLWRSEAVLLLADSELSASLRPIRLQRNTLQSREPAARRDICPLARSQERSHRSCVATRRSST